MCLQVHPLNSWLTMPISNTIFCNGEHRMQGVMADKGRASPVNDGPGNGSPLLLRPYTTHVRSSKHPGLNRAEVCTCQILLSLRTELRAKLNVSLVLIMSILWMPLSNHRHFLHKCFDMQKYALISGRLLHRLRQNQDAPRKHVGQTQPVSLCK